jgi:glycosyltransferase involved in cell wall biosynthesis
MSTMAKQIIASSRAHVLLVADSLAERRTSMDLYAGWIHDALIASGDGQTYELLRPPIGLHSSRVALKWRALRQRYVTIPRAIRSSRADIVHVLDPAYGHLIPLAAPAPVVVTCHDLIPVELERWSGSRKALSIGWHLYRRAIGHLAEATAIVVPTATTKRRLIALMGPLGDKVWTIPNGVDEAFHNAMWVRPQSTVRVLHVGTNAAYKQIGLVVDTVVLLAARGHSVELVKAGPRLPDSLARQVAQAGVGLTEHPDNADGSLRSQVNQAAVYADATLLLFPSSHEGFGLPVAEAMAVGLPVVASDIDVLQEVTGGHAAHVSGDAASLAATMDRLLNEPGRLERMSGQGRSWARRYRWSAHADDLRRVYAAVSGTSI